MLTLSSVKLNRRPTRPRDYEWRWGGADGSQSEFRAIAAVAEQFIQNPPVLRDYFGAFPHRKDDDAVMTGARGALSQHVIFGLARTLGFTNYLEVGTRYAYSIGAAIAGSRRIRHAVTVDPFVEPQHTLDNLATLNREQVKIDAVQQMSSDFDTPDRFDAVYVDGDHSYEVALADVVKYWQYVRPGGLMLVDDTVNNRGDAVARRDLIGVYWAVKDFLDRTDDVAAAVLKLPTYSGFAIIQKQG